MKLAIATALAAVLVAGASARANFIAIYTGNTNNVYRYTLRFTVDQPGEVLHPNQDFVTLYDVAPAADLITVGVAGGGGIASQVLATGTTPTLLTGAAGITDSAGLVNVTFRYVGNVDLTVNTDFVGPQLTMAQNYTFLTVGTSAGQTHTNFAIVPPASGDNASIRAVLLPATQGGTNPPEPASLAILGLGGAALMFRRRKA